MVYTYMVNYPEMVVQKSTGVTPTEKKLISLGYQTFLGLWSYPNPFKSQPGGKELCDLLVVFENNIIIFSDKDCKFQNGDIDIQICWRRWYRNAIKNSARQLLGAKKWIKQCPDRISMDSKCEKNLPLKINITPETEFHLIAVAHGASEGCKQYYHNEDGGMLINSTIVSEQHTDDDCIPFCIGLVEERPENFIHVFDDMSYETILRELDTIEDFLTYLRARKETLLKKSCFAFGEKELLAKHISGLMLNRNDGLMQYAKQTEYSSIFIHSGLWDELVTSKKYRTWRNQLVPSYFWDELLSRTFYFIENGLSQYLSSPTFQAQDELFSIMAKENRKHRLILSEGFLSFVAGVPEGYRGTRILLSEDNPSVIYLLLVLPRKGVNDSDYRNARLIFLDDYCKIIKVDYPNAKKIIGVALDSRNSNYSSEDFVLLDAEEWTAQDQADALEIKEKYRRLGLLSKRSYKQFSYN